MRRLFFSSVHSLSVLAFVACGNSGNNSGGSTGVTAASLGELKLSKSMQLSLPSSLKKILGKASLTTNNAQLTGRMSREACQAMFRSTLAFDKLQAMANGSCHFEVESLQIQFGKKYKIAVISGGTTSYVDFWLDSSLPGQVTNYICEDGKLIQKDVFTESNANGAKGTSYRIGNKLSDGTGNGTHQFDFDFLQAGVRKLTVFENMAKGGESYVTGTTIEVRDTGLTSIKMSSRGTWNGATWQDRGSIKDNGTKGQAIFRSSSSTAGRRGTFDGNGISIVNTEATPDIVVAASDLPELPDANFAVGELTGWNCATTETATINFDSGANAAAHKACEVNFDYKTLPDCTSSAYEDGDAE